jgi:hypothetical protein
LVRLPGGKEDQQNRDADEEARLGALGRPEIACRLEDRV